MEGTNEIDYSFSPSYRGRELQRRLSERVREADADSKDRNKEQEELDELKNKIFSGEYDNPTLEFEKAKKEREELYKPKILIDVNLEQSQQRERELERERMREIERQRAKDRERANKERYVLAQASRELASVDAEPIESDSSGVQDNFSSPMGSAAHSTATASNGPGSGTDGLGNSNHHHGHHHHHHHHHHPHSHHHHQQDGHPQRMAEQRVASAGQHPPHAGSETRDSFGMMSGTGGGGAGGLLDDENSRHSIRSNSQQGVPESPDANSNSGLNSLSDKSSHHPHHSQLHQHHHQPPPQQSTVGPTISLNLNVNAKKKKLEVKDVFNSLDDDTEESNGPKKRKLVPLGKEGKKGIPCKCTLKPFINC